MQAGSGWGSRGGSIFWYGGTLAEILCTNTDQVLSYVVVYRPGHKGPFEDDAAWVTKQNGLPVKSTGQIYRTNLPDKSTGQIYRSNLPVKSTGQIYRLNLHPEIGYLETLMMIFFVSRRLNVLH
jgi:hypothetical protein